MLGGVNQQMLEPVCDFHTAYMGFDVGTVEQFLQDPTYDLAYRLFTALLELHGRGTVYKPFLEALAEVELASDSERQRDHVIHSCLVYCVGIFLYESFGQLRCALDREMTESEIEAAGGGRPQYSNDSPRGEFGFRWRLAALCHDLAYPFVMSGGSTNGCATYISALNGILGALRERLPGLRNVTLSPRVWFRQLNHLSFARCRALHLIEGAVNTGEPDLAAHWRRSRRRGWRDHGIASAVFIYRMADLLYEYHNRGDTAVTNDVNWNPRWLTTSMAHALAPIAYHSLPPDGQHRPGLERVCVSRPLVGLLRLADALQDWDRRYFHDESKHRMVPGRWVSFEVDEGRSRLTLYEKNVPACRVGSINRELSVLQEFPVKARAAVGP